MKIIGGVGWGALPCPSPPLTELSHWLSWEPGYAIADHIIMASILVDTKDFRWPSASSIITMVTASPSRAATWPLTWQIEHWAIRCCLSLISDEHDVGHLANDDANNFRDEFCLFQMPMPRPKFLRCYLIVGADSLRRCLSNHPLMLGAL